MNTQRLKGILARHIVPMFPGSELSEGREQRAWKKRTAFLRNGCNMVIRPSEEAQEHFVLTRSQAFDQSDADFVEAFIGELSELEPIEESPLLDDLINPVLRRTVAERVSPRGANVVAEVIAQFEKWAQETYEGRKIAAAIGVDSKDLTQGQVDLLEVFAEPFGTVLANGLESFIKAGQTGQIIGYEPMRQVAGEANLLAPIRFGRLAEWSNCSKVGLGLTRNGEVLVFTGGALLFAKRRGTWRHFTHQAIIKRVGLWNCFDPELCRAVYETCLDVSFAKTGGGVALIQRTKANALNAANLVSPKDRRGSATVKGRCLSAIINGPFQSLDRRLRQDIVALDGATILDHQGHVVAAGAIVKVEAGSDEGGGRLAAARRLSEFGCAIKVSSDGGIRGFKHSQHGPQEMFSIG